MSDIRIYVMAHKAFHKPEAPIYVPLQVGAALHPSLGYMGDHTGDHISEKNPNYSELSGLYWVWKNGPDCDISGLCHYRRYFLKTDQELLYGEDIEEILRDYDVIVSPRLVYPDSTSIYQGYQEKHYSKDLDLTRNAIEKYYPEYLQDFDQVMAGHVMYFANMMITSQKWLNAYAEWLFTILFEVEQHMDMSGYDDYNRRVYGFLGERLMLVWLQKNRLRIYECPVGVTESKSETKEAIDRAGALLLSGDYESALEYLQQLQQSRPDAFYKDSDTQGVLAAIYTFGEIMAAEQRAGRKNLRTLSMDYRELIAYCQELKEQCVAHKEHLLNYIEEKQFSPEFLLIILPKLFEERELLISVYNTLATAYLDRGDIANARIYVNEALRME